MDATWDRKEAHAEVRKSTCGAELWQGQSLERNKRKLIFAMNFAPPCLREEVNDVFSGPVYREGDFVMVLKDTRPGITPPLS